MGADSWLQIHIAGSLGGGIKFLSKLKQQWPSGGGPASPCSVFTLSLFPGEGSSRADLKTWGRRYEMCVTLMLPLFAGSLREGVLQAPSPVPSPALRFWTDVG